MLLQDTDGIILSLRPIGHRSNNNGHKAKLYDTDFRYNKNWIEINPVSNIWIQVLRLDQ